MKISHKLLSADALNGLLDEFVTRDSDFSDGTLVEKRRRVLNLLERERAFIVLNEKDGTTDILSAEEYASKRRDADS